MVWTLALTFLAISWEGFTQWVSGLTFTNFLLFFWPLIIFDLLRSVGKPIFLLLYSPFTRRLKHANSVFTSKISVIIPAHNEEAIIVRSIESALNSDYPNKEVIVVDDGSSDRTYHLASFYAAKGQIKLIHRDQSSGSKASALNYGLLFASGEVIVPLDADTIVEPNALTQLVSTLGAPNVSAASGNVRILSGESGSNNLLVKMQAYEYLLAFEIGRRFSSLMGTLLIISGAFGAFYKKYLKNIGEYDSDTLTEDFDLTIKFRKLGGKIAYANNSVCWTFAPDTWKAWRNQRIRWTKGEAETFWKHRNVFGKKGFDLKSVLSAYDMLFLDVVVLVLRFVWLFSLIFFFPTDLFYVLLFSLILYLAIEFTAVILGCVLSGQRSNFKNVALVPIMVFFYRPYYALVRMHAYIKWVLKQKTDW